LLSEQNVDHVSTLASIKTILSSGGTHLTLLACVVKAVKPNGFGDLSITVKVHHVGNLVRLLNTELKLFQHYFLNQCRTQQELRRLVCTRKFSNILNVVVTLKLDVS